MEDGEDHDALILDAIQNSVRESLYRPTPNLGFENLHRFGKLREGLGRNFDGLYEAQSEYGVDATEVTDPGPQIGAGGAQEDDGLQPWPLRNSSNTSSAETAGSSPRRCAS